jgi:Brp/Blh family beta-carotene 15,15'-monooxygenase
MESGDVRVVDAVGWFGPAGLALCTLGVVSPFAASAAIALAVATTLTLGVGHGALDHELPERLRRAPRSVTLRIAVAYAALVGAGFAAFLAAPLPMLLIFLAVSVAHFGAADIAFANRYAGVHETQHALLRQIALGLFPIVVPVVAHPEAVLSLMPDLSLSVAAFGTTGGHVRFALLVAVGVAVIAQTYARIRERGVPRWYRYELGIAFIAFVIAPPVVAFFMYFGAWHAARHAMRLAEAYGVDSKAAIPSPAVWSLAAFALRALPMTAAALAIAASAFVLFARVLPLAIVAAALAFAVTVPHTFAVRFFNRVVGLSIRVVR